MKVKRLKINSFRGIGDLTLEFDETEPTVLIGVNGVGKSSILDCLAILLSDFTGRFPSTNNRFMSTDKEPITINVRGDSNTVWLAPSAFHEQSLSGQDITRRLLSEQDLTNGRNETHNEITVSLDSQEVVWTLKKVRKGRSTDTSSNLVELEATVADLRRQLEVSSKTNLPLPVYYPVNRSVLDIPLEMPSEHLFEQVDAFDQALTGGRIGFRSFFEWFRVLEDLENEERRDNPKHRDRQLEAVRHGIFSLLPGFSDLRVRRSPLRMTVTKQGQELIINQLSDGEKCLLALAGDLARRLAIANPGLSDPLQGSGVVLIDEIELHLHPKWQRKIIPALVRTFPNCQFIVTTHSPQVIGHVKPQGIYLLEAVPEGIVARRPGSSFGRDSNRILEDLMGVPERPQEIKDRLRDLFRLIDSGLLAEAKQLQRQIEDRIGADEPEFASADVLIRRKEILGR